MGWNSLSGRSKSKEEACLDTASKVLNRAKSAKKHSYAIYEGYKQELQEIPGIFKFGIYDQMVRKLAKILEV